MPAKTSEIGAATETVAGLPSTNGRICPTYLSNEPMLRSTTSMACSVNPDSSVNRKAANTSSVVSAPR